jgi:hypothetical protein
MILFIHLRVYFNTNIIYNINQDLLTLIGKCLDEGSTPSISTKYHSRTSGIRGDALGSTGRWKVKREFC